MLLYFSADIHAKDYQGLICSVVHIYCWFAFIRNTALHMAAWQNHADVVDLLLLNGAFVIYMSTYK